MNDTAYASKEGKGLFYLWHLQAIGLIERASNGGGSAEGDTAADAPSFKPIPEWPGPQDPIDRRHVAIIDNGATAEHPNLPASRFEHRIDYAHHRPGARFGGWKEESTNQMNQTREDGSDHQPIDVWSKLEDKVREKKDGELEAVIKNFPDLQVFDFRNVPDPSSRFAAHGTACAGLVAASTPPALLNNARSSKAAETANPWAIRYVGVNPKARIIPINTAYNHEYWPVINGLLWAMNHGASVILMPRAINDLSQLPGAGSEDDPRFTRFAEDEELKRDKRIFERLLGFVSELVPVVVAAGNDGRSQLQYPASLVDSAAPNLIVVGACTSRGRAASYSSHTPKDGPYSGVTIYAPSDDAEEISKKFIRYDQRQWRGRQLKLEFPDSPYRDGDYSPYGILAIDIPGTFGYSNFYEEGLEHNDEGQPDQISEPCSGMEHRPGSLYTVFGGTSAAASIVAGVVSLMQMQGDRRRDGTEIKKMLCECYKEAPDFAPGHVARVTRSDDPPDPPPRITMLIDAAQALRMVAPEPR